MRTVVEDGEADEAVGVDVLVYRNVSDEDDFRGLDGLPRVART
jgi:hypothetical protein